MTHGKERERGHQLFKSFFNFFLARTDRKTALSFKQIKGIVSWICVDILYYAIHTYTQLFHISFYGMYKTGQTQRRRRMTLSTTMR